MALVKTKPTSAGRRSMVKVVNADLHKGAPYAPLVESQSRRAGRNHQGNITTRHQGGGHKQHYRTVGRMPLQRLAPALPIWRRLCSSLPTSPMVARQLTCTRQISPERMRSCA